MRKPTMNTIYRRIRRVWYNTLYSLTGNPVYFKKAGEPINAKTK
ncbi:hypothetical protein EniLVp02_0262 [Vibrio phage EniLVp02]